MRKKRHYYTKEQDNWLREHYSTQPIKDTLAQFNSVFHTDIKLNCLTNHCNRGLNISRSSIYTQEQREWLISYYPHHTARETATEFNKIFNKNVSLGAINTFCDFYLHLKKNPIYIRYSPEEKEWMKTVYPTFNYFEDAYQEFCKTFHREGLNKHNLIKLACILGVKLDKNYYSPEELEWIKEHYRNPDKEISQIYEEFCRKFGNRHPYDSFKFCGKRLVGGLQGRGQFKLGEANYKTRRKDQFGISREMVLCDLGNGEFLPVEPEIYTTLRHGKGNLKNGEITKTMYEVVKTQHLIRKVKAYGTE